jgi:hypothetical protein
MNISLDEQLLRKKDELEQQLLFLESFRVHPDVIAFKKRQIEDLEAHIEERKERRSRISELKQRTRRILSTPVMLKDLYGLSQKKLL